MLQRMRKDRRFPILFLVFSAGILFITLNSYLSAPQAPKEATLASIVAQLEDETKAKGIKEVHIDDARRSVTLVYEDKKKRDEYSSYPTDYATKILDAADTTDTRVKVSNNFTQPRTIVDLFVSLLPLVLIGALIFWLVKSQSGGSSSNKAISEIPTTRFSDLAGVDEAIEDLGEVTDFLRDTSRYQKLGARSPKGVLLYGAPGTGKQLHKDVVIPTWPGGYSTVGELKPGDIIIDDEGKPTKITAKFQPMESDLYEVKFNDGSLVKCGGSHLWEVQTKEQRARVKHTPRRGAPKRRPRASVEAVAYAVQSETEYVTVPSLARLLETSYSKARVFVEKFAAPLSGKEITSLGLYREGNARWYRMNELKPHLEDFFNASRWDQRHLQKDKNYGSSMVMSTSQMIEFAKDARARLSVKTSEPVQYPAKEQELDAYALGLWLGDGFKNRLFVIGLLADIEFYETQFDAKFVQVRTSIDTRYAHPMGEIIFGGLSRGSQPSWGRDFLRLNELYSDQAGVSNKHIPLTYLNGSFEQRLALLQGIMDTDGSVSSRDGSCGVGFSAKNPRLIEDTYRLITSLGIKVYRREKTHFLDGVEHHSVSMDFYPAMQVFRLPRKVEKLAPYITQQEQNGRLHRRYFVSIDAIQDNPEDYYCFTVDSPSHLFLCTDAYIPTHNTALARAVAGESGVPFFHTTGSAFAEMFVGLGARRVRNLFKAARKHGTAIVFIDELDSVGGKRSTAAESPDSREHSRTINALLAEMDGFEDSNVIVIAATNHPDGLDPALTRAGRFDRKISVDLPDWRGRMGILAIHSRDRAINERVDFESISKSTTGLSGADLENLVNEALICAGRAERDEAIQDDFMEALSVVTLGRARKSAVITEKDKKVIAAHEAGHAIVGLAMAELPDPSHITIVPRGLSGGHTKLQESEDKFETSTSLRARLAMIMGGLAAEKLVFGDITQGPGHDLAAATDLASKMIASMGMGSTYAVVEDRSLMVNSAVSEAIRLQVETLIVEAIARADEVLAQPHWGEAFARLQKQLLEEDTVEADEIQRIKREALSNSEDI